MTTPQPAARRERRATSSRVYWALVGLFFLVLGGFFVGYWRMIHYERQAYAHVPGDSVFALRLDVEQVVLFEPVRRHLLPLVGQLPWGEQGASQVEERAGTRLAWDLRELLGAVGPDGSWALVLGGLFDAEKLGRAIVEVANEKHPGTCRDESGSMQCGSVLLRAPARGLLVVGQGERFVAQAMVASTGYQGLGLAPEPPASLAIDLRRLAALPAPLSELGPLSAVGLTRVEASLELSEPVKVQLTLRSQGVNPLGLLNTSAGALDARIELAPEAARPALRMLLRGAEIRSDQNATVIRTNWSRNDMVETLGRLGFILGGFLH